MIAAGLRFFVSGILISMPASALGLSLYGQSSSHLQDGRHYTALSTTQWMGQSTGLLGIGTVLLLAGAGFILRRRWRQQLADTQIPLIVDLKAIETPAHPAALDPPARPADNPPHAVPWQPASGEGTQPPPRRAELEEPPLRPQPVRPASASKPPVPSAAPPPVRPEAVESPRAESGPGEVARGNGTAPAPELRADESLQLLPGQLEILAGADGPADIRFFRTSALETPEVTLGRSHGPAYRHIHLWAPSVSRVHARMRFERGQWTITNLSRTNPLCINGLVLDGPQAGCTLSDGDRIQLGEVVLRYRDKRDIRV